MVISCFCKVSPAVFWELNLWFSPPETLGGKLGQEVSFGPACASAPKPLFKVVIGDQLPDINSPATAGGARMTICYVRVLLDWGIWVVGWLRT